MDTVQVTEIDDGLLFDGSGTDMAIIFYPSAKVEYTAYAPLMWKLAEEGVDCFLLEMPYNMAIYSKDCERVPGACSGKYINGKKENYHEIQRHALRKGRFYRS